jgi:hypothetical protein
MGVVYSAGKVVIASRKLYAVATLATMAISTTTLIREELERAPVETPLVTKSATETIFEHCGDERVIEVTSRLDPQ